MKQVLGRLIDSLEKVPVISRQKTQHEVLHCVLPVLRNDHDLVRVRAALQICAALMQKQTVTPDEVAIHFFSEHAATAQDQTLEPAAQSFLRAVLPWIQFQHTEYAAARAAIVFIKVRHEQLGQRPIRDSLSRIPFWVSPLTSFGKEAPGAICSLRTQLFPDLFALDIHDYFLFLQQLGFQEVLGVQISKTDSMARAQHSHDSQALLFAALQAGKERGLVVESRK